MLYFWYKNDAGLAEHLSLMMIVCEQDSMIFEYDLFKYYTEFPISKYSQYFQSVFPPC